MRDVMFLFAFLLASSALAQVPDPLAIPGRFVRFGYDLNYPTICGDLLVTQPEGSTKDNGPLYGLQSRNVVFDVEAKVWRAELYTCAGWNQTFAPRFSTSYYPEDHFAHTWLSKPLDPGDVLDLAAPSGNPGVMRCHGYDGKMTVPGDLQPGLYNGVYFALWARNVHIIKSVGLYHFELLLGTQWIESVYSTDLCDYDPRP